MGRRISRRELIVVGLLFGVAAWRGAAYVGEFRAEGKPQVFYQQYFEPAAMIACGFGFTRATPEYGAAMNEFLQQRQDTFDCAALPADQTVSNLNLAQHAWFYLMWTVGLYWKIAGVSWSGLLPLFGALFGLVIVLAYTSFRLVAPMGVAILPAAGLMISTLHTQNLPHLRDYAKAPFVLALILILFWIVKHPPPPRRLMAWCAFYGLVLGIGYGFRTDFLANIPPLFVTVLFFLPGFDWKALAVKTAAVTAGFAVFVIVAWPVISYVTRIGGCQWHVVLLGLEYNYNDNLAVTPSYYQWITRYTDEYVHTSVNSFLYRTEGTKAVPFCDTAYDGASARYLATIAREFPADVVTRAYTSTLRVMDMPFYLWGTPPDPLRNRSWLGHQLTHVVGTARLAAILAIVMLGAMRWRWGLFALFVLTYFGGYPMMQFAPRHFFHLEFIGWWAIAFVLWQAIRTGRWAITRHDPPWPGELRPLARRGLAFAVFALVMVLIPLPIVRAYHDPMVSALTETLLTSPRVPLATAPASASSMSVEVGDTGDDPTATVYLDVRIDLAACPAGVVLTTVYDKADPLFDFTIALQEQPRGVIVERYLTPVFRGFQGLSVGDAPVACVRSVERLSSVKGISLLPTLTLPANWQDLPRHQQIGAQALRIWRFGP